MLLVDVDFPLPTAPNELTWELLLAHGQILCEHVACMVASLVDSDSKKCCGIGLFPAQACG